MDSKEALTSINQGSLLTIWDNQIMYFHFNDCNVSMIYKFYYPNERTFIRKSMSSAMDCCKSPLDPGGILYIKMPSYQYKNSHGKDNMVSQPSYFYNGNSCMRRDRLGIEAEPCMCCCFFCPCW